MSARSGNASAVKVSGFSFIRNGLLLNYPFLESYHSVLPLLDELVVAVGNNQDATRDALLALQEPKIKLSDTVWDETLRTGGRILAQQTDVALALCDPTSTWALYIQADEVLNEKDYATIRHAMQHYATDSRIEGLLFNYLHFYGTYNWLGGSPKWYRREVRIVRNASGISSWGDAQGFRREGRKLRVALIPATVYHYGWVRTPEGQRNKAQQMHRLWHDEEWMAQHAPPEKPFQYDPAVWCTPFTGTHPQVMHERIAALNWDFFPGKPNIKTKDRLRKWLGQHTGWIPGEYRNYTIVERFRP